MGFIWVDFDLYLILKPQSRRDQEIRPANWYMRNRMLLCKYHLKMRFHTWWNWQIYGSYLPEISKGIEHWLISRREPASDLKFPSEKSKGSAPDASDVPHSHFSLGFIFLQNNTNHLSFLSVDWLMIWWCPKRMMCFSGGRGRMGWRWS